MTLVLLACLGCSSSGRGGGREDTAGAATSVEAPSQPAVAEDLGLPDITSPWGAEQYAQAAAKLEQLASTDAARLPRYRGVGQASFARIVSEENLAGITDSALAIETRMQAAIGMLEGSKHLLRVYMSVRTLEHPFGDELVELQAYMLAIAAAILPLADEFMATQSPEDPTYQVRVGGLEKMRVGFAVMVTGAVGSLAESPVYTEPQLVRLAGHLERLIPRLIRGLESLDRAVVAARLEWLMATTDSAALKAALASLLAAVNDA